MNASWQSRTMLFLLLISSNAFSQSKLVSCSWEDGTDYFVYEINEENDSFRFSATLDYGTDSLSSVPHKENDSYKEYIVSFSKQKIEHCRLNKKRDINSCYTLNRVKGTLTKTYGDHDPVTTSCVPGLPASKF